MTTVLRISLCLLCVFLPGCTKNRDQKQFRIAFSQCGEDDAWRRSMISDMRRELAFYPELDLLYVQADNSSALQVKQVEELLKKGIDLLVISPNEAEPLTEIVESVYRRGIPVIIVDRKTNSGLYTNYIGADNYEIGKMAGEYAANLLDQKGNIIEIGGLPLSSPAIERKKGFRDALKLFPGVKIIRELNGSWVKTKAKAELEKHKGALSETDLIFAHNDMMAWAAHEVCGSAGAQNIKIIGVDALPGKNAGLELIYNKILTASVLYPTGGAEAIRNASQILRQQPVEKETILQTLVVDANNVRMMRLQTDKIQNQQEDIEKQQVMLDEQRKTYRSQRTLLYILGGTLILVLALAGLLYYSRRVNLLINKKLERKNLEIHKKSEELLEMSQKAEAAHEARLSFFTNVSHELRTPLSLILAPLEELTASARVPLPVKSSLLLIQKNANRLLRLVNQLIDFRKIEFDKMRIEAVETDMNAYVADIVDAFQTLARKKNIDCRFLTKERAPVAWVDPAMFDKVLFNLLSNAFKFTRNGGYITVTLQEEADSLLLKVEDNGIGMTEKELRQSFDPFYQADHLVKNGSGLGLPLSRELVRLHHGTLEGQSQKDKGSTFIIRIPLGDKHFTPDQKSEKNYSADFIKEEAGSLAMELAPEALREDEPPGEYLPKTHTLLIIDDNSEIRHFLKGRLEKKYYVCEAVNGIDGLKQAFEIMPDLILCDIMMPGKDGITVSAQLKEDVRTGHIPVILLSAKTSVEHRVAGLKSSADAYLTKPFNVAILEETVNALLANREKMKEHFSSVLPQEISHEPRKKTDRKFVSEFTAIVEKNIGNPYFTVDEICSEMMLSKIQLYRKAKALLETNINEYILNARIQKAKYLLQNEDLSISEVAQKTGFSSSTYFSTVFRSKTGITPSQFKK